MHSARALSTVRHADANGVSVTVADGVREFPFASFAGVEAGAFLWMFGSVRFASRDLPTTEIAGVRKAEASSFARAVKEGWNRYLREAIDVRRQAILTTAAAVAAMKEPNQYPAACIMEILLDSAKSAVSGLPTQFPAGVLADDENEALTTLSRLLHDPKEFRGRAIDTFVATETELMTEFFDRIEKNPLTAEQRLAVVADEDATLVLAGAGSGKTSVIVGKAAHLVTRRFRKPHEIVLMSYGKKAAEEIAARVKDRIGVPIEAKTFHSLGFAIIGSAEGRRPALAPHASDDAVLAMLLKDMVHNLMAEDARFAATMRTWFAEFFAPYRSQWEFNSHSEYLTYVKTQDLRTLKGDRVRSFEECEIANWLFMNGIAYEYEPDYEHDTGSSEKRVYTPDFRLTASGVYIEHFGVRKATGPDGRERLDTAPGINREQYLRDMDWKRRLHREHGTTLVETYSYEKSEGRLTEALAQKIAQYATPEPIPTETLFAWLEELGRIDSFTEMLASFLHHFKGNGLTVVDCENKLGDGQSRRRNEAFLQVFAPVFTEYQKRLGDRIDFEDMIVRATQHVREGRYQSPYHHLLIDEFQDISLGRADLLKALLDQHEDSRLYAVGDDWQAIFGFAGSDPGIMRSFAEVFGGTFDNENGIHRVVDLGRTFRCVDKVALPAVRFVVKNPSQLHKSVVPAGQTDQKSIRVTYFRKDDEAAALQETLRRLHEAADTTTAGKAASVYLLGRYNFLKPDNINLLNRNYPTLDIKFSTVHRSKGLEADHVVVLGMNSGRMGFPSEIVDDPVLAMALPGIEPFPNAEERRLFYVAMTRARSSVHLLSNVERPSSFVSELAEEAEYSVEVDGEVPGPLGSCPRCGGRLLRPRGSNGGGRYLCEHGKLCGNFSPACPNCEADTPTRRPGRRDTFFCSCGAEYSICHECGDGWLLERNGPFGRFLGCSHFPDCRAKRKI